MANAFGSLQLALDLLGVFVFAVSGALVGVRKDLDVFGVLCLALATSLAGGIVRDVLLDATPVGVSDWRLVACALVAGLIGFRWSHHVERLSRPIKTLDAAGLALFSVSGAIKALTFGANGMEAVILGLITAVGGGVIRDLLSGIVPEVLRRELYAVPAIVGGILVVLAAETGTLGTLTASGAVAVVFCYRLLAIVRHWHAPHAPPPPVGSAAARRRARWDRATRRARIVRRASAVRRSRQSSGRGSAAGPVQQDPVHPRSTSATAPAGRTPLVTQPDPTQPDPTQPDLGQQQDRVDPYDGLVLLSFGGPEQASDVMPFLRNVTAGRGIPDERLEAVAQHYYLLGGRSPVNEHGRELVSALVDELGRRELNLPVYFGNRNWDPFLVDALREAHDAGARRLVVVTTSAYSSYSSCRQYREDIAGAIAALGDEGRTLQVDRVRGYYNHPGFARTVTRLVTEALRELPVEGTRIVFVTHSIPDAMDETSGPGDGEGRLYQREHLDLAVAVTEEVNATLSTSYAFDLTYCSRSGPPHQPWLEPDINDHLEFLAGQGVERVVCVPFGFVSDHMEVIYDLDHEAQETATRLGVELVRVPTVGVDPEFVSGLVDLVEERAAQARDTLPTRPAWPGSPLWSVCPAGCCPNLRAARPAACGSD